MAQEKHSNDTNDKQTIRAEAEVVLAYARSQLVDLQLSLALASNDALRGQLTGAVGNLSDVVRQLSRAVHSPSVSASDLAALAQAVQANSGPAASGDGATLVASDKPTAEANVIASAAYTRQETQSVETDIYDRKIFDPYLRFKSPEDEAEYRQREADNKKYIDGQFAKHTPEGDLNASGGAIDSMLDAHAHGAGASPEFLPHWKALVDSSSRQRAAMQAAGQSTAEYDAHISDSVRRYLKGKGLSDSEINARLAASKSPLDAVAPFITNDKDAQQLEFESRDVVQHAQQSIAVPVQSTSAEPATTPTSLDLGAISAKLKAAGFAASPPAGSTPDHGLTIARVADKGPNLC